MSRSTPEPANSLARVERLFEDLRRQGVKVEALLPVHDELLIEVEEKWAEEVSEMVKWEMERALVNTDGVLECRCPVLAESKVMKEGRWEK